VVRYRRRFNRREDLDVKVSKEALSSAIRSGWCSKGPATGHDRPQGQEGRTGLETIPRHRHAAIPRGGRVNGVFSETFPSHDMARRAAERAAKEQVVPGDTTGILYEDKDGRWHDEVSAGDDRPETDVEG
jgi:hypothetical protein